MPLLRIPIIADKLFGSNLHSNSPSIYDFLIKALPFFLQIHPTAFAQRARQVEATIRGRNDLSGLLSTILRAEMTFVQTRRDSGGPRKVEKGPDLRRRDTLMPSLHYGCTEKGKPPSASGTLGIYIATMTLVKVNSG